jgi:UDP-N-acetylglucosamine 4-epimerase
MKRIDEVKKQLREQPKRWLVTGGAGFIGSHIVDELLDLGQTVVVMDNFSTGSAKNLWHHQHNRNLIQLEASITMPASCEKACRGTDVVLHHAAVASVPYSIDEPWMTNEINATGFVNMLVAAKQAGIKRFIYASSSAVYGGGDGRVTSPYAASKIANEAYAHAFHKCYGMETIGLRYFNIFGPRQRVGAVIPTWIDAMLKKEPCKIFGDGETTRDYCFVKDAVDLNILAATTSSSGVFGRAFSCGSGKATSLNHLWELFGRIYNEDRVARKVSTRIGDIVDSVALMYFTREDLGFTPTQDLKRDLKTTFDWYKEKHETI